MRGHKAGHGVATSKRMIYFLQEKKRVERSLKAKQMFYFFIYHYFLNHIKMSTLALHFDLFEPE